jgi:hypothetical protein
MSYIDRKITGAICTFYPGTYDQCLSELKITWIKFGLSILLIILGFLILSNKSNFIQKILAFIFRYFGTTLGGIIVVVGSILLSTSSMELIYK